jgi:hypothetical protein
LLAASFNAWGRIRMALSLEVEDAEQAKVDGGEAELVTG